MVKSVNLYIACNLSNTVDIKSLHMSVEVAGFLWYKKSVISACDNSSCLLHVIALKEDYIVEWTQTQSESRSKSCYKHVKWF